MTAGNVHDSQCFETLLTGTESAVYGDIPLTNEDCRFKYWRSLALRASELVKFIFLKLFGYSAYKSQKHDDLLKKHRCQNFIICKANRNKPLTKEQKAHNKISSSVRYVVERKFGILELRCKMGKAKYNGLARTTVSIGVMSIMHNLKRGLAIANDLIKLQASCA